MKKNFKILCLVLALVMVLPMAFGCVNNKGGDETQAQTEETASSASLMINGASLADYTIVYSRKAASGGEDAAKYLNEKLEALYGATLPLESKAQDRYEILIGLDGGDSTIASAYKNNPKGIIGVSGKKIIILGATCSAMRTLIDAFLAKATGDGEEKVISFEGFEAPEIKTDALNVMTYNVLFDMEKEGRPSDALRQMVDTVIANDVDVLGTQEDGADNKAFFLENLTDYEVYIGDGDEGNYIYWKKDKFNVIKKNCFYLSNTPTIPSKFEGSNHQRTMVYVILEYKETGKQFLFVNVHADYQAAESVRVKQLEVLGAQITKINKDNLPVIVLGDFNSSTTKSGSAILDFLADNPNFDNTAKLAAKKGDSGSTLASDFVNREDKTVIDYVLVTTDNVYTQYYTVVNNAKDGKYPSDHLPVFAKVDIY